VLIQYERELIISRTSKISVTLPMPLALLVEAAGKMPRSPILMHVLVLVLHRRAFSSLSTAMSPLKIRSRPSELQTRHKNTLDKLGNSWHRKCPRNVGTRLFGV
jgi:hypothetical protein